MKTNCPRECDAAAWLGGELPPGEAAAFAQHLSACSGCRQAVEATRRVLGRLQSLPAPEHDRDLAPDIIAKLRARPQVIPYKSQRRLRAAAAVAALLLPATLLVRFNYPGPRTAENSGTAASLAADLPPVLTDTDAAQVSRALDWFCVQQEIDGSWDPAKWGGNRRFQAALTALPLISLLKGARGPAHGEAADRALAWLRREQNEHGSFARFAGDGGYNHGLGTLALLHACAARPTPALRASATSALHYALRTQNAGGGWGDSVNSDVSVTLWYRETLELAARLGWDEAAPALARASRWLQSRTPSRVTTGHAPEVEPLDYLEAYFTVAELLRENTAQASARRDLIRRQLRLTQSLTGENPGTWEPAGSWGRAGGRIYSTALACLALR